jgi:hypothetical protein
MSLMPTAPSSIGGVLDQAFRLYGKSVFPCMPIVLVTVLITIVPTILLSHNLQSLAASNPQAVLDMARSPNVLLVYLVMVAIGCVTYGALFAKINAIAHDEPLSIGGAFAIGLKRAPFSFLVGVLFVMMVAIGCVLLLIPGIYLWGLFQLAFVVVVVERAGVFTSFGTSARLVSGNWWRASVIMFVAFVVMVVLFMVIALIAGIIAGIFGARAIAGAAAANPAGVLSTFQLIQQIVSAILDLFIMSFFPSVLLAVYYDLKLRKEGGDLAARVGELKPAG